MSTHPMVALSQHYFLFLLSVLTLIWSLGAAAQSNTIEVRMQGTAGSRESGIT